MLKLRLVAAMAKTQWENEPVRDPVSKLSPLLQEIAAGEANLASFRFIHDGHNAAGSMHAWISVKPGSI